MTRLKAGVLLTLLAAWPSGRAFAQETELVSPTQRLRPSSLSSGGHHNGATANSKLGGVIGLAVADSTSTSSGHIMALGLLNLMSYPNLVTDLATLDIANANDLTLQWTSPGYDGGVGALRSGTSYYIRLASYTVPDTFQLAYADVVFSTANVAPGALVSATFSGLVANTTYFVGLWTKDRAGNLSYFSNRSTDTTLARAPVALANTFLSVQPSTVTLAWGGLTASPPDPQDKTSEGYVLEISSTNFGQLSPGGVINMSSTTDVLVSTLTVMFPDLNVTTNYYRVASLNWRGRKNYLNVGKMNFQITQSAANVDLGAIDMTVAQSTVSMSSIVVTNVGDLPVTLIISGDMATVPVSSWTLTTVVGVDSVTLQGLWNTGPPAPAEVAFGTFITPTQRMSQVSGNYAGDQNGVAVPPGQSRTLWFRLQTPSSTSSNSPEVIGVDARAVLP